MRKGGGGMRRKYWIALLTAPPGDHCELHEPKAPSYARAETEMLWFPLHFGYMLKNYTEAVFPTAIEDWGSVMAFATCWGPHGPQFDTWERLNFRAAPEILKGAQATFSPGNLLIVRPI